MGFHCFFFTILLLQSTLGEKVFLEYYYSNEQTKDSVKPSAALVEENDVSTESVFDEEKLLENLRELLRQGDPEYEIEKWAPFEDNLLYIDDVESPFALSVDGFDDFEKVYTKLNRDNTAEFQLFFPRINFKLYQETDESLIYLGGMQKNTTLTGVVKMDPKPKCIRFYGIDVDLDFERIDYTVFKHGDVNHDAEQFVMEYLTFFLGDFKDQMIDSYEEMIEEEVEAVFEKLECWYYSPDKLLSSYKNSL